MTEGNFSKAAFQEHINDHKLMASRCQNCGSTFLPPRPLCISCFGDDLMWVEVGLEGELIAFTIVHIAPTAMIEAGYGRENPYCSGIIKLTDGLMISAQILGVDVNDPENIRIGTPLKAEFIDQGEGDGKSSKLAFRTL